MKDVVFQTKDQDAAYGIRKGRLRMKGGGGSVSGLRVPDAKTGVYPAHWPQTCATMHAL